MARHCTYHCRSCNGHFVSLRAFDLHRDDSECTYLDERLVEVPEPGVCKLADSDVPRLGVTLYAVEGYRDNAA